MSLYAFYLFVLQNYANVCNVMDILTNVAFGDYFK